jgi:hypothetical protein
MPAIRKARAGLHVPRLPTKADIHNNQGEPMPCEDCPEVIAHLESRAEPDDPRKTEFYSDLLPRMLTPRYLTFVLNIEVLADFEQMESMSHQMVMAYDEPNGPSSIDAIVKEAEDILYELDTVEDVVREDAQGIAEVLGGRWPLNVSVDLKLVPSNERENLLEVTEE